MDRATVETASRGASPLLLVLAALAFLLLPVIGVSCNTSAAQPILGAAIGSLGGGGDPAQMQKAQQCLQQLSNRDLVTYSGTALAFGSKPSVNDSNTDACNENGQSSQINNSQGGIGVQPLFLAAFILIVAAVLLAALRAPLRNLLTAGSAVVAFALLLVGASSVHTAIFDQIDASSGSNTLSSLGVAGTISSYFDVHSAVGLWLVYIALLLVVVVNAVVALMRYASTARAPVVTEPPPPPAPPPVVP